MQMWAIILANEFPQVGVAVKTRVVAGATILSAVVYQTVAAGASAQTSLNPLAKASSSQAGPSIEFLRPIKNEGFFDYPIFIQVGVERFKLVPPNLNSENTKPGVGHIDYTVDDFPVFSTDETQIMFGKNLGYGYIPVGRHVLKAELVDNKDHSLNPAVVAQTVVWSGHPAQKETYRSEVGAPATELAPEQLRKVQQQLEQVQLELLRVQNGSGGYQPMRMVTGRNGAPGE